MHIVYKCIGGDQDFTHTISITGQNDKAPEFNKPSYEATITKLMPVDVPLHFVDTTLDITATDGDFVCVGESCFDDDTSSNEVKTCIVEDDKEKIINCEPRAEGDAYRIFLTLKKRIEYLDTTSYTFKIKVQVRAKLYK